MVENVDLALFREILIVLAAVSVVIPIFHSARASPVLGFLLIGMMLGPSGLGGLMRDLPGLQWLAISDRERIGAVAQFGIVLVFFMIGLEMSFERLNMMRRLVFGLGPLQVLLSAAAITGVAMLMGQASLSAIVIGLALAMSSTAVIIQVLSEEKRLHSSVGRASFAILLFQDIAVVPVLFAVGVLANTQAAEGALGGFAFALAQAAIAIGLVVAFGRVLMRPLFRAVARTQSPDLFMAACLFVLIGSAFGTAAAGMSMAIGALLAGLLLAETEYRRQIEVLIEPFKGLLLGVFLISMGMTIDLKIIVEQPLLIVGLCLGLLALKGAIVWALVRLFGSSTRAAIQTALLTAPGGEFSFVILMGAAALGALNEQVAGIALMTAGLTMATIPFMSFIGRAIDRRMAPVRAVDPGLLAPEGLAGTPRVIIVGYGRVGEVAADLLQRHQVEFLAINSNPDVVAAGRAGGAPVFYGDATNNELLRRCGLEAARALVVTMDSPIAAEQVVAAARAEREDLIIVARARDARHAARLYAKGATDAVPETVEASLLLSETLLVDIGVPTGPVIASIHDRRAEFRTEIQKLAPEAHVRPSRRRLLREQGKT